MEYLRSLWLQKSSAGGGGGALWRRAASLDVIIMGAGRLGQSLTSLPSFSQHGLRVVGVFDSDPSKIGLRLNGIVVESPDLLSQRVEQSGVLRAIIAVPPPAAQLAADQLVEAGIRLILNYAPVNLRVPTAVVCERIDPAVQFARLSIGPNFLASFLALEADAPAPAAVLLPGSAAAAADHLAAAAAVATASGLPAPPGAHPVPATSFSLLRGLCSSLSFSIHSLHPAGVAPLEADADADSRADARDADDRASAGSEVSFFHYLQRERSVTGDDGERGLSSTASVGTLTDADDDTETVADSCSMPDSLGDAASVHTAPHARSAATHTRPFFDRYGPSYADVAAAPCPRSQAAAARQGPGSSASAAPAADRHARGASSVGLAAAASAQHAGLAEDDIAADGARPASAPPRNSLASQQQQQHHHQQQQQHQHHHQQQQDGSCGYLLHQAPFVRSDQLLGLDDPANSVRQSLQLFPEGFAFSGILLFGPPGSGKSALVNSLIAGMFSRFTIFSVSAGELTASSHIRALFSQAAAASAERPVVVSIDAVDSVCRSDCLKLAFRKELDRKSARVVVLASTNLPWELDMSVLRHFERRIAVPLPDDAARKEILRRAVVARHLPMPSDSELMRFSKSTVGYSASDLVLIVKDALGIARDRGEQPDLAKSISHIKPTISEDIALLYATFSARFGHESPALGPSNHLVRTPPPYMSLYC